jgi:hypothetical protein
MNGETTVETDAHARSSELEEVGEEVVDIVQTWLQTGLGIGLAALGAAADALRATGDALGRLAAHLERSGAEPEARPDERAEP